MLFLIETKNLVFFTKKFSEPPAVKNISLELALTPLSRLVIKLAISCFITSRPAESVYDPFKIII